MIPVKIHTEYITLGQFLKLANCVSTGGEAKIFLSEKDVWVNGDKEIRRGRKLYPQDIVKISAYEDFQVVVG